jgi:hypothetical protein
MSMHEEIMQLRIKRMRELGKPENETVPTIDTPDSDLGDLLVWNPHTDKWEGDKEQVA